jgi:hypothetical protein
MVQLHYLQFFPVYNHVSLESLLMFNVGWT